MASMKLGSKPDVFHLEGQTWLSSTGLPSDVVVKVNDVSFRLHKFPLLSRSGLLEKLIGKSCAKEGDEFDCTLDLPDLPGGAKAFLSVAKFCYGVRIELTAANVVGLRCAAEHLEMTEDYGEENLVSQSEGFLNEVFGSWGESLRALEACDEVMERAEELHVVSRCLNSLAMKACSDVSLFNWPVSGGKGQESPLEEAAFWNGIRMVSTKSHMTSEDWWYEDVSSLRLSLYKRVIGAIQERGIRLEKIAGSIMYYAKKHVPLINRQSSFDNGNQPASGSAISPLSESEQRTVLEELVEIIPNQKGVTPTGFLLRILRTSMMLRTSTSCIEKLEKLVGSQLDQAILEDILILNMNNVSETLYDIECVHRILNHFMVADRDATDPIPNCVPDESHLMGGPNSLTPMTMVANLIDGYLAEVATDAKLKLPKFQGLAVVVPDYARPLDDGIYHAIDIYLKAHPWLTELEREQVCRLMNCQKLSMDACTHAAQNERLPLRVIVQVLFFEQLRLRTSIAGWFFVSDNLSSQDLSGNLTLARSTVPPGQEAQSHVVALDDVKVRVMDLERECLNMKQELQKMVKTRGSWNVFFKRFAFRLKKSSDQKTAAAAKRINGKGGPALPTAPPDETTKAGST
ncbi:hypothetical protein MLD38_009818 [Melastoma candidum]|uniref:Uncharacterized protein n=1 Tax=Melastoma candidum TaxID=119954 RepID=A0ACB9S017_9MYRT|nr:hypothetical protein MLD38_009818 [Melastoma candidum]